MRAWTCVAQIAVRSVDVEALIERRSVRPDDFDYARHVASLENSVELLSFVCPRCATAATERLYGPCISCREDLRANQKIVARDVEVAPYEPKMNVTPNFVATKE